MPWLTKQAREQLEFIFKVVQAIVVVVGVVWAAYTFWDTRYRELSKPYEEKKLEFYTEAGRVLAARTPTGQ
jgi:membrane peptidoglycan carboxypeptidase